jgi:hypothetical protein
MRRRIVTAAAAAAPVLLLSATGAWAFSASFAWCVRGLAAFFAARRSGGHRATAIRHDGLEQAELSSWRRHRRLSRPGRSAVRRFRQGFVSPSPPPGVVHTYEFTVKALGANGAPLATTTVRRKFPE